MKRKFGGMGTLFLLALAYALDTEGVFPYFVLAAALHELGHVLAVLLCGARVRSFGCGAFGFTLRFDGMLSYGRDAVIACGGAAMNLLCAVAFSLTARRVPGAEGLAVPAGANLLLGIFNLLPALPLDGGRVFYALLARWTEESTALAVTRAVSLITGAALTALGLYILVKTRYNMSILAVGGLILGGIYAEGAGTDLAARAQARALRGRRICAGRKE